MLTTVAVIGALVVVLAYLWLVALLLHEHAEQVGLHAALDRLCDRDTGALWWLRPPLVALRAITRH